MFKNCVLLLACFALLSLAVSTGEYEATLRLNQNGCGSELFIERGEFDNDGETVAVWKDRELQLTLGDSDDDNIDFFDAANGCAARGSTLGGSSTSAGSAPSSNNNGGSSNTQPATEAAQSGQAGAQNEEQLTTEGQQAQNEEESTTQGQQA